jgi:hypothetical protein
MGGVWMTGPSLHSTLHLKNLIESSPVTITPVLHVSNGKSLIFHPVTIGAGAVTVVDINAGLDGLGLASYATLTGFVEIRYQWPWIPICATVRNTDSAHSLLFNYFLQPWYRNPPILPASLQTTNNTLEGAWWKQEPNISAMISLANTSDAPELVHVTPRDSDGHQLDSLDVTVLPGHMNSVALTVIDNSIQKAGGLTVTYRGPTGSLIVSGNLRDESTGYSATIPFSLPLPSSIAQGPTQLAVLGLMSGPPDSMMQFPANTVFTPYSIMRNTSNLPITVIPTFWWMEAGTQSPR